MLILFQTNFGDNILINTGSKNWLETTSETYASKIVLFHLSIGQTCVNVVIRERKKDKSGTS